MHDVICLSHLRWNFVWQRPQHLMTRFARDRRVFFVEEPMAIEGEARLDVREDPHGVTVVVPRLPTGVVGTADDWLQAKLLRAFLANRGVEAPILWYYTPMALAFTRDWPASAVVYDCMDELSAFDGAPGQLPAYERELMSVADVVFTGGQSLYEAKRALHPRVFAFPSSVDVPHFRRALRVTSEPADQASLPRPRLGFYGVIDERLDVDLLAGAADLRPDWQFVMLGPIVKIDPKRLPRHQNVHYLGAKPYAQLPEYLGSWDVARLPFARNDTTRFISPTKTPEYLAGGRPVVSTSIRDVVHPYQGLGLVRIADEPVAFVEAAEHLMREDATQRQAAADRLLETMSWDRTWEAMCDRIRERAEYRAARARRTRPTLPTSSATPDTGALPLWPRWANLS